MKTLLGTSFLAIALFAPGPVAAFQDHGHDQAHRYYDKQNKDWHDWNDNENQAYHRYVQETHARDREFSKLSRKQQQNYYKWRHEHMDDHH